MTQDDSEKRIADLERQLAEQKRITELQSELAEAKAGAEPSHDAQQPVAADVGQLRGAWTNAAAQAGVSQAQLNQALQHSNVTISAGRSFVASGQPGSRIDGQRRRTSMSAANRLGGVVGAIGGCIGGAAALTAMIPSSAMWTSAIVCGGPDQLMVNTSHYSYKPGQSGTSIDFQCLGSDGAHHASFVAIGALQTLVVALVVGAVAMGIWTWRRRRAQTLSGATVLVAGCLAFLALVVVGTIGWQALGSSAGPLQMPHGGNLTIHGNGETKAIACNDGHLTIGGRDETVTITGHCASISVDGVIHHVTVDSVDAIHVGGVNNVITYHSGTPQITQSGAQNAVHQG